MRQAAKVYFETQVTTTSRGQVLIMLYDGAIKFLNQAKELMAAKDYAGKGRLISSAIDVINELASSLNPEKGGELAANLNQLYFYCNKRLFMANSRMDPAGIDEVIKILNGIRSAYAQIIDTPEAVAAMQQASATQSKTQRVPAGIHAAPAGPPVSTAKARNAYATQSTAVPGQTPQDGPGEENGANVPASSGAETRPAKGTGLPPAEAAPPAEAVPHAEPETVPALPGLPDLDLDTPVAPHAEAAPPPFLTQGKRLTASNLYRKFAS